MLDYQYTPLVEVRGWCGFAPGAELFESSFVFENYPLLSQSDEVDRLRLQEPRAIERPHYPLTLQFGAPGRLQVKLTYAKDRFAADAIGRLAGHLQRVLEQLVADPHRRLADLDLLHRVRSNP